MVARVDENNPGVWDGAPEWATNAEVRWTAKTHYSGVYKEYTRTLPKTKAREIAESKMKGLENRICTREDIISALESVVNEALGIKDK